MNTLGNQAFAHVDEAAGTAREFEPSHPIEVAVESLRKFKIAQYGAIEHHARTTDWVAQGQKPKFPARRGDAFIRTEGAAPKRALDAQIDIHRPRTFGCVLRIVAERQQCA